MPHSSRPDGDIRDRSRRRSLGCEPARDYERDPAASEAMVCWAAIGQMVRRLARGRDAVRQRAWTSQDLIP